MIYDIRQFRFGDSDVTKIRLSAVSSANSYRNCTVVQLYNS